jgi:Uma2 family endonuclease
VSTTTTKSLKRVRWTVEEYFRMAEIGLFDDRRVELINGEVVAMAAQAHPHRSALSKVNYKLVAAVPASSHWLLVQGTLLLPRHGAPDPDFHVFDVPLGTPDRKLPLPFLVIEISDTTYLKDSGPKLRMYAKAGIQDYWILNLPQDRLEVYRQPSKIPGTPGRWGYAPPIVFSRGHTVSPLSRPDLVFAVNDLLP